MSSHRLLSLEQARPEMVLAEAVCRANGLVFLPAGTQLTELHLQRLQTMGVREISVAGMDTGSGSGTQAATAAVNTSPASCGAADIDEEAIRTRVRRLFRKSEHDAVTQGLFKAVLEYRLEKSK